MKHRKKRCWKGYKPVKGKRPYSKGSCRKIRKNAKKLTADERWHLLKQSRDRYVKRAMIPLRTAKAMVRAGLPVRRSELRGNPLADLQILTQITSALKNLKKRNNNDEMIESITMRRRPGYYPTDYIIVVKHRYFVNGSRVYSAGLKTEETIEKFVRVIGRKTKRIGNSDYAFNIYGVRFPEAIKKKPGKLFDNPKSFPNIEKSRFNKPEYVGYSPKAVNVFSITRGVGYRGWRAIGQIYKTIGAGHQQGSPGIVTKIIYGKDLAEISKALENL